MKYKCRFYLFNIFLFLFVSNANAFIKMSYVEVNSNNLSNIGCYVRSDNGKPYIDFTSIFAANINGSDINSPEIYFNPQVSHLLNNDYDQISNLQKKGVKVLITLLGNHQDAGWACLTQDAAKQKFAKEIVNMVNKYKLDGVDIDDEYSTCFSNRTSISDLAHYIKNDPNFNGKILTKALFNDDFDFSRSKLAKYLDYGWEMTYSSSNFASRLNRYLKYGMNKEHLFLGGNANQSSSFSSSISNYVKTNDFGGAMIYNITTYSWNFLNDMARAEYDNKLDIQVLPNCLK
ncbi:glycosyl hydrolase family 18 protein [Silvanigrella aquatica]|uniref:GH18 domain-containing protein n=1 Tax=Silvanigrella aquatica TaxID=1915309 RepID=A0A1L4D0A2_9BACT|nr:glycosyl hydrolase family 18 protein [Silvanigrella aquatica]APJ03631.1 hypothetical protein AXG55_06810 [Silvanigrella aquatica]